MAHSREVRVAKVLIIVAIVVAGFGNAVLYLWNWLMPAIFGLPAITFWQALGLMGLSWILFGGLRGFGGSHPRWSDREWRNMTPEERERFRSGMRARWCGHGEEPAKRTEEPAKRPEERAETPPYQDFA